MLNVISQIAQWCAKNLPTVIKVGNTAARLIDSVSKAVDAFWKGRPAVGIPESRQPKKIVPGHFDRPEKSRGEASFAELSLLIEQHRKDLQEHQETDLGDHHRINLDIEVLELIVSSQTLERFVNGIRIHVSNLSIHLHSIRNMAGMLDDINRQRGALYRIIGTINHMHNVLNLPESSKISDVDIDVKPGTISVYDAYLAFENTRSLLIEEISALIDYTHRQEEAADRVRKAALRVPDRAKAVSNWLVNSIDPLLVRTRKDATLLKTQLELITRWEGTLRRKLENGKLE